MDILIIGGTRNLGHLLALDLLKSGQRVTIFNRGQTPDELPPEVQRLHGDRSNAEQIKQALVCRGTPVGVLAYLDGEPVGWCSIAPRETYQALERYRALPRIDSAPVWSVVCFFVDRRVRRQGVTLGLLQAAVEYARSQDARVIEGYPVQPGPHLYTYMGSPATFLKAGFHDVTPPGQGRQVMRYVVESK